MKHIMVDLETLGTRAGCAVLAIGAVEFSPDTLVLGAEFYAVVSRYSCARRGLFEDSETLSWWDDQSEAAREVLRLASVPETSQTLPQALGAFNRFLFALGAPRDLRLYGNGADFDNPILTAAYAAAEMDYPVRFGGRCYRTLKSLDELFGSDFAAPAKERVGTYHNALDDAKTQAAHLLDIVKMVKGISRG